MRIIWRPLAYLALYFFCLEAMASVFEVDAADRSKQYLGTIFSGSVGTLYLSNAYNPLLSKMFEKFNLVVITIGSLMLAYIVISSTINTSREGEAMGKKVSLWLPLRALLGMLTMVPTLGSGYSILQMTVMWIVLNGVGAANQLWGVVLNQLSQGVAAVGSLSVPINISDDLIKQIARARICMDTLNNMGNFGQLSAIPPDANAETPLPILLPPAQIELYLEQEVNDITPTLSPNAAAPNKISSMVNINVGVKGMEGLKSICGSFLVNSEVISSDNSNGFNIPSLKKRLQIKVDALISTFDYFESLAKMVSEPPVATVIPFSPMPSLDEDYYNGAIERYTLIQNRLAEGIKEAKGAQPYEKDPVDQLAAMQDQFNAAQRLGWIHAGNFYFSLVNGPNNAASNADNGKVAEVNSNPPMPPNSQVPAINTSANSPTPQWSPDLFSQLGTLPNQRRLAQALYFGEQAIVRSIPPSGIPGLGKIGSGGFSLFAKIQNFLMTFITKEMTCSGGNCNVDPIVAVGRFGHQLMVLAESGILIAFGIGFTVSIAGSFVSCMSSLAWALSNVIIPLLTMGAGLFALLWGAGATLGIYVPLVPYLIFTTTAMGWLFMVTEAIVAAPIIALALVHPSQEELGKITPALGILAHIFLKPSLMIFGFVLAAGLLRAIVQMINFGFVQAVKDSTGATLFSFAALIALYTGLIVAVVNQAFSLIYKMDILKYMGISASDATSQMVGDTMGQAKGGFDKGSQAGESLAKSGGEIAASAGKRLDDLAKKRKEGGGGGGGGGALPSPAAGGGAGAGAVDAAPAGGGAAPANAAAPAGAGGGAAAGRGAPPPLPPRTGPAAPGGGGGAAPPPSPPAS